MESANRFRSVVHLVAAFSLLATGFALGLTARFTPAAAYQGNCRTFAETGKQVCGRFLEYWQQNGGLAQQGLPLSNEFVEVSDLNGQPYTVQYFERTVFEKHPENARPFDVLLSQLGTFQFKRKYPSGDPGSGQPQPTPRPAPTTAPPATGPRLEIQDYTTYKPEYGGPRVVGVAKNTGSVQLGSVKIVATLKDSSGKIVGTESESGPGGMMPGDLWPFSIGFLSSTPSYTSVEFQIEAGEASRFDKEYYYRDYQVSDINVLPATTYSGIKIVGTVKNTGQSTGSYPIIYVLITDAGGKVVDADYGIAELTTLGPGQSSPFSVTLDKAQEAPNVIVVAYSTKK